MKQLKTVMLLGALVMALSSCVNFITHDRSGQAVTFGASSDHSPRTKTAYSGVVSGGRERIDWENGDQVRVFMYTHDANNRWGNNSLSIKDYCVVGIQAQGEKSVGQLMAVSDKLEWVDGREHDFYSVYPPTFSGYNNQMSELWFWGNRSDISFKLPSSQDGETSNMGLLYMAAVAEGYNSDGRGSVVLQYYPMVTALHFSLQNLLTTREAITITEAELSSTDNTQLTGTYSATISGGQFVPSADNIWDGSTSITVSASATVPYGSFTDFVFFLAPRSSYDPSKLKLTLTTADGKLSMPLGNVAVPSFESCKKYNLILNLDGSAEPVIEVTQNALILASLSDSPVAQRIEYLAWMNPPGLYYRGDDYPRRPISSADLTELLNTVTNTIINDQYHLNYLLKNLVPDDFIFFPNLTRIHLAQLGNTETVRVENLENLSDVVFSGNPQKVTISHCSFSEGSQPLVLKATRTMDVDINNVSGLTEVHLVAGDDGGGNIGNVTIHDCPDLKVIKVYRSNNWAQVAMETAQFDRLPALETIYLDQVNATNSITISNCDELVRVILANQTNWLLKSITLANLPLLGDSAPDSSEYGLTGFNVDKVSMSIYATKVNCPNLGAGFETYQPYSESPVTIAFH